MLVSPNFFARIADVPQPLNANGFKQFGMAFYLAFTNGQHIFEEIIVEGDKVVTCGTFTATHLGDLTDIL